MQGQRAPGIDGLTVEFYKAFWDILAADILDVFNESLTYGSMPVSCRRAVLTLLQKKGNLQDIKNWRPVSLLCVDYKLLSKALANRLREAMEQVIHRDQTYCVPGRSMVDNVYLIRDVLEVSSSLGIDTGLISLDQEKAFDRIEHNFLWKVMESFGFNAGFIAKIKVLYSDIESVLKINGSLCAPFRVHRGVRQGCALSGMLYALSLEPLLNKIRSSTQGLLLPGFRASCTGPVHGARLDISSSSSVAPGLTAALCRSRTLSLQQLVDAVAPALGDAEALSSLLSFHLVRVAGRILSLWRQKLSGKERSLLIDSSQGKIAPNPADSFPDVCLSPELGDLTGPLLTVVNPDKMTDNYITWLQASQLDHRHFMHILQLMKTNVLVHRQGIEWFHQQREVRHKVVVPSSHSKKSLELLDVLMDGEVLYCLCFLSVDFDSKRGNNMAQKLKRGPEELALLALFFMFTVRDERAATAAVHQHQLSQSLTVEGGAAAVPGGDAASQDPLYGSPVEAAEDPGVHVEPPQPEEEEEPLSG
ncbi:hypothetical protein L3Q82_020914 [Scortum barcoo]|uniref:Uncharacterized protein n=1 Tax=Scortum barcoo TaxID=214431 RepID=A0ACB8VC61_9TELE|nr:hypothetical protein L3Q82_020914 [Scortum barcoo]